MDDVLHDRPGLRIIKLAQYLTGLTAQQDVWSEAGKAIVSFFGVDLCAVADRGADGTVALRRWFVSDRGAASAWFSAVRSLQHGGPNQSKIGSEIQELFAETMESGFLASRLVLTPEPLAAAFLPISHESQVVAVMLVGSCIVESFSKELLDLYLAVAGLVGSTVTRLASEKELRQHRQHLAKLVDERTIALSETNRQLEQEVARREQVEAALLTERDNLTTILEAMEDLICIVDSRCEVQYANPAFEREFGPPDGRKCFQILAGSAEECPLCDAQVALAGAAVQSEWFYAINGKTYDRIMTPLIRADGNVATLAIFRDITERARMEAQLRKSETQYRLLAENMVDVIWTMSPAGQYTYVSPSVLQLRGYSPMEALSQSAADAHSPTSLPIIEDALSTATALAPGGEQSNEIGSRTCELEQPCKDGSTVWTEALIRVLWDDEGKPSGLLGVSRDITERKQAERRAFEPALERERMAVLSKFIQDASHEFRTPLSIMHTNLFLLERLEDPARRRHKLMEIAEQVTGVTRLVELLAEMARLDSDVHITTRPTDLNELVRTVAGKIQHAAETKRLTLRLDLAAGLLLVEVDGYLVGRALYELLDNAVRYAPADGAITLRTASGKVPTPGVSVEVRDAGCGIPADVLPHVFERFFREDAAHTTTGFGLGLPIARSIAERHGGQLDVESQPGVGSVFRIWLPQAPRA